MDRTTGSPFATRSEVLGRGGMAACSQPLATQTAVEVLRSGGSAMDAAIAANAVLCVVEPTGAGIGGDLFALAWDAEQGRLEGLNGSGRSPRDLRREHFTERGLERIPRRGALAVSVPGCVHAWGQLHERQGRLPLDELLAPAIEYAREGFPVSEVIAAEWAQGAQALAEFEGFREQFLIEGRAPRLGEVFRNPNLADTLQAIAEGGPAAFYRGEIAEAIEATVQEEGGFLSTEDLEEHRSAWVDPISTTYRGFEVFEVPPNSQGPVVLQMLNLLEHFDLGAAGFGSADHLHLFTEAKKLAYEDRARWIADPEFSELPTDELISKEYAKRCVEQIDPRRAARRIAASNPSLDQGDTVYLCTADAEGNMVSLIQSNFRGMGSGIAPGGLGFVLQNRGELFDLAPGRGNSFEPGKRPFHTILPAFVTHEGKPYMAFGVMGGAMQPQGQVQILLNHLDFGMGLQAAGDAPRVVHEGSSGPTGERMRSGGLLALESGFEPLVLRQLMERGHRLGHARGQFGGYQAIGRDPYSGVLRGASESRKDGYAAGF